MILVNSVIIILISLIEKYQCLNMLKVPVVKKNETMCEKMIKHSYFETEMVIGEPWRILYTWNMFLDDRCIDMTFTNATTAIINEIWNDMYEYLEDQPIWPGATLHMSMGPAHYELLMFAQPGTAGAFTAVPNIVKKASIPPPKHSVTLLSFYLTLVENGRFLVVIDCQIGVGSLLARESGAPTKEDVILAAAKLDLGVGYLTCTGDKKEFLEDLIVQ